jgi:aminocarboxymuconate-semialdehyde decarboxylase
LSDAALAPFWAKAEQLGALIVIHPNGFSDAARFYFNNVIGNPLDTALALHYLIFGGVLERYPNSENSRGAWRRISGELLRAHGSRLEGATRPP